MVHIAVSIGPLLEKKLRFILSVQFDFHMTDKLRAVDAFASRELISI